MALTWSQRRNPDSEHPSIRLPLILEEPVIHLKGAGSNILIRDPKRRASRCKWRYSTCKRSCKYLVQDRKWLGHLNRCIARIRIGSETHFGSSLTSKGITIRILKDKCVISGKQGQVINAKRSGSFYSTNCYTTQIAVTKTPNSESHRFLKDAK